MHLLVHRVCFSFALWYVRVLRCYRTGDAVDGGLLVAEVGCGELVGVGCVVCVGRCVGGGLSDLLAVLRHLVASVGYDA